MNRRQMMWGSTSALLLAACAGNERAKTELSDRVSLARRPGQPEVGIQTYTIRDAMDADTPAALRMLKEVGYDFVENYPGDYESIALDDYIAMLRDAGLPVVASHFSFETLNDTPERAAEIIDAMGARYANLAYTPEEYRTTAGYTELAGRFNSIGEVMRANGSRFAYHNHHYEFWKTDGPRAGLDIYLEDTDPDLVDFELDLFWATLGRRDVPELFRAHPGRFKLCHVKDMDQTRMDEFGEGDEDFGAIHEALMVDVGEGDLPFERWLGMSDVSGIEYMVVEHDAPSKPLRDAVTTSLATIRSYNLSV